MEYSITSIHINPFPNILCFHFHLWKEIEKISKSFFFFKNSFGRKRKKKKKYFHNIFKIQTINIIQIVAEDLSICFAASLSFVNKSCNCSIVQENCIVSLSF